MIVKQIKSIYHQRENKKNFGGGIAELKSYS